MEMEKLSEYKRTEYEKRLDKLENMIESIGIDWFPSTTEIDSLMSEKKELEDTLAYDDYYKEEKALAFDDYCKDAYDDYCKEKDEDLGI